MAGQDDTARYALMREMRAALRSIEAAARRGLSGSGNGCGQAELEEIAVTASEALAHCDAALPSPHGVPPLRVLVVDGDAATRHAVLAMLVAEGHEAVEALDGRDAMRRLLAAPCDVILMDMGQPDVGGPATVRAIRTSRTRRVDPTVPVVGLAGDLVVDFADAMGCDAWLARPFAPKALRDALAQALAGRQEQVLPPVPLDGSTAAPGSSENVNFTQNTCLADPLRGMDAIRAEYNLDPSDVATLYTTLLDDLPLRLDALDVAFEECLDNDIAELAHTMAGSALGIVSLRVVDMARRAEGAARRGDPAAMAPAVAALRQEVAAVVRAMRLALEGKGGIAAASD
ncbi:MAG: response regulator [Desulfovibrionaceae bacterium]